MSAQKSSAHRVYAVITGDIVGSTRLSKQELAAVRTALSEAARAFVRRNDPITKGAEFFQGDSWQILLGNPHNALHLALLIEASLRGKANAETRAAIGIGTVDGLEKTAALSTGEAFMLSGRALDTMTGTVRLTGSLPDSAGPLALWFPTVLHLCSSLIRGWTRRQAEVMSQWLSVSHPTYEAIASAQTPPIATQSVGDILKSANLPALREALAAFHRTDWQGLSDRQERQS